MNNLNTMIFFEIYKDFFKDLAIGPKDVVSRLSDLGNIVLYLSRSINIRHICRYPKSYITTGSIKTIKKLYGTYVKRTGENIVSKMDILKNNPSINSKPIGLLFFQRATR